MSLSGKNGTCHHINILVHNRYFFLSSVLIFPYNLLNYLELIFFLVKHTCFSYLSPLVVKILECSIKLLFETRDISQIKQYVQNQCMKLLEGKASMQDFIFAKEYRGSSAYRPGSCVPALEITR